MLFSFLSRLQFMMLDVGAVDMNATSDAAGNAFAAMVQPIVELLNSILGPAIALVAAIGSIYCILLGVKLAKAEEPQEHQKAKMALKNAIIGFVLIFVLIVVLRVGINPLITWMNGVS